MKSRQIQNVKSLLFACSLVRFAIPLSIFELVGWVFSNEHKISVLVYIFILFIVGYFANKVIFPYTGFNLFSTKQISSPNDFIPLSRIFISRSKRELNGYEYEELVSWSSGISDLGKEKFTEIKSKGLLTEYDQVNLWFFEEQIGKVVADEQLKEKIKSTFNDQ